MENFTNYVLTPFKQWKDYKSETTVKDFWLGLLSMGAILLALAFVLNTLQMNASETVKITLGGIFAVFLIYWFIAFYALQARRLNHRHTSKWWLLLVPATNIATIAIIVISNAADTFSAFAVLAKFGAAIYYLRLMCTKADS